jgi:hypothetical protein
LLYLLFLAILPPVRVRRLQEPLPRGRFDLAVSALAVHHLIAAEKSDLFARIASALRASGAFVLGEVVVSENADDRVIPIEPGVDFPDRLDDQLRWLADAQLEATVVWTQKDLAVIRSRGSSVAARNGDPTLADLSFSARKATRARRPGAGVSHWAFWPVRYR